MTTTTSIILLRWWTAVVLHSRVKSACAWIESASTDVEIGWSTTHALRHTSWFEFFSAVK